MHFYLPEPEDHYNVIAKYNYAEYPGNPNGSDSEDSAEVLLHCIFFYA